MKKEMKWSEQAKKRLMIRRLNEQLRNYESLAKNAPTLLGRQIGKERAEEIIKKLTDIKGNK